MQITGDYTVSGSTLTLDYASQLYTSTSTNMQVTFGAEATANFTVNATSDTNAVSQLVTVIYNGANWIVSGSSTSGTVTIANGGTGNWPSAARRRLN